MGGYSSTANEFHGFTTFWFHGSDFTQVADGDQVRLLLTVYATTQVRVSGDTTAILRRLPPGVSYGSTVNRGGAPLPSGGSDSTSAPVTTQTTTRTLTVKASDARAWVRGNSSFSKTGEVIQGYYRGVGNREGAWWFPDFSGTVRGAKIKSVQLRFYVTHTYASAGATAELRLHGKTSISTGGLDTQVATQQVRAGRAYTVNVPSEFLPDFASGKWRGFGMSTASTSSANYMRARSDASMVIVYEK